MDDFCFLCLGKIASPIPEMLAGVSWCSDCLVAFRANFDDQQQNILTRLVQRIVAQDERISKLERGDLGG